MAGTAPDPHDDAWSPDAPQGGYAPRSGRAWVLTVVSVVVVVLALVTVLLVWQPWQGPLPDPVESVEVSSAPVEPASPTPGSTGSATPAPPPGADTVFDATTAATLLVTAADVENGVPGAAGGVRRGVEPGTRPWGLPEGTTVDPASCAVAVTVTQAPPSHHDATSWTSDDVVVEQDVVVLLDRAAAQAAFRALVTTVDGCPRYTQTAAGGETRTWTAEPAIEGQGVFPAIVHDAQLQVGERTLQQTSGHLLVGNAIVTWTATARTAEDRDRARDALGDPAELGALVERRALAAVRGLS